jgi:hypothetical protein
LHLSTAVISPTSLTEARSSYGTLLPAAIAGMTLLKEGRLAMKLYLGQLRVSHKDY